MHPLDPYDYPGSRPYIQDDQDSGAGNDGLMFVALAAGFSGMVVGVGLGLMAYPCASRFIVWMWA